MIPNVNFAEKVNQDHTVESETTINTSEIRPQEGTIQTIESEETNKSSETTEMTELTSETLEQSPLISSDQVAASVQEKNQPEAELILTSENDETVTVDSSSIYFEKNQATEEFVSKVGDKARKVAKEKDLFASVMIAQAILESESGSSPLAQEPYNNLFGIKGVYEGNSVSFSTLEDDGSGNFYQVEAYFRQYSSAKESFEDYSKLLTDGIEGAPDFYQATWKSTAKTYQNATQALTGTYATDTQYSGKLNGLIETYNLTQYDLENELIVTVGDYEPYNNVNYDRSNSYAVGNCTQYVYNRITQLGGHVDLNMGNGADWGTTGRAREYQVSNIPKSGTAVSFAPSVLGADPTYGHVAFVEKVNDDGSILISEMNAVGLGVVSARTIPAEFVDILTYVTPK